MKNKLLLAVGSMALLTACDASKGNEMAWFDHAVKTSGHQLLYMAEQLKNEPDTACFPVLLKKESTDWSTPQIGRVVSIPVPCGWHTS